MATVPLRLSEPEFWRLTPRKLLALWKVHKLVHGLDDDEGVKFIDQVL